MLNIRLQCCSSSLCTVSRLRARPVVRVRSQSGDEPGQGNSRRDVILSLLVSLGSLQADPADAFSCPGLGGYALQQCLREKRKAREAAEAGGPDASSSGSSDGSTTGSSVDEERLRSRQYDQPGTLVTLPSGIQYREIEVGTGAEATVGSTLEIQYTVYRLSSGAYFKYSSGGTPVLLWAVGSGFEGRDDIDEVYRFTLGEAKSLPAAATPAVVGMRVGGRRRILLPPRGGWVDDSVGPRPPTFGGQRRLVGHREEPLLFEVSLVRVNRASESGVGTRGATARGSDTAGAPEGVTGAPYRLPAPPSPFKNKLGPASPAPDS